MREMAIDLITYECHSFFFEEEYFRKNLSNDAKIVYSLLLNRVGLSYKNGWIEKKIHKLTIMYRVYYMVKKDKNPSCVTFIFFYGKIL